MYQIDEKIFLYPKKQVFKPVLVVLRSNYICALIIFQEDKKCRSWFAIVFIFFIFFAIVFMASCPTLSLIWLLFSWFKQAQARWQRPELAAQLLHVLRLSWAVGSIPAGSNSDQLDYIQRIRFVCTRLKTMNWTLVKCSYP